MLEETVAPGRNYDKAEFKLWLPIDSQSYLGHWALMQALLYSAQYEEAAVAERGLAISGRHVWALASLGSVHAAWGRPDEARAVYRELEARSARVYVQPAMTASAVGDIDVAIAVAQRALDDTDPLFVMLARIWQSFDRLCTGCLEIVRQLHLPDWSPAS